MRTIFIVIASILLAVCASGFVVYKYQVKHKEIARAESEVIRLKKDLITLELMLSADQRRPVGEYADDKEAVKKLLDGRKKQVEEMKNTIAAKEAELQGIKDKSIFER